MNKFLDSAQCIYEPIKYCEIKEDQIFTKEKYSIFCYRKTNKTKKVEVFHGGRWTGGPMGTLVWDDNAEYIPSEYKTNGLCISLLNDKETPVGLEQKVYLVKSPIYLSNLKHINGHCLKGDDSYMLELARNQLKNDYGVDIGEVPRNQQSTIFILRNDGAYQCKECGGYVDKNFKFCPFCGRKHMFGGVN